MKKKFIFYLAGLVILIIATIMVFTASKSQDLTFRTADLKRGNIDEVVTATGQLSALKTVQIGTQVSGTIMKLNVDYNSRVRKGEIIAVLDTNMLAATVEDAEANLNHIKAQLIEAKNSYQQEKALFNKKLDSETNYYTALSNYKSLAALKQQAEADLNKAKINLNYATIKAPINGIVISRNVDVGQTVAASLSAPTLFTIANDLRKMQVQADVDEADIGNIKVGQTVTFTVDTYPDEIFRGMVSQVRLDPQEIQNVVNYTVIINVNNGRLKLMPGMTATVSINIAHRNNVLEVPDIAFYFQPSANMIDPAFLKKGNSNQTVKMPAQANGKNNLSFKNHLAANKKYPGSNIQNTKTIWLLNARKKIYPVRVKTGLDDGTFTEISNGNLKQGEQVVLGTLSAAVNSNNGVNPFAPQRRFNRNNRGKPQK